VKKEIKQFKFAKLSLRIRSSLQMVVVKKKEHTKMISIQCLLKEHTKVCAICKWLPKILFTMRWWIKNGFFNWRM